MMLGLTIAAKKSRALRARKHLQARMLDRHLHPRPSSDPLCRNVNCLGRTGLQKRARDLQVCG